MSGIVGVFHPNRSIDYKDKIQKALETIIHRGPDSTGYYFYENFSLGSCRLATQDLENGNQPISYKDDRYILAFDGSIYNYKEIRQDLESKSYTFNTDSEAEVLAALFDSEGFGFLDKIRGYFVVIIWDNESKRLFGARDNFGIAPLYYKETKIDNQSHFYFSSEKKAILSLIEDDEIDGIALQDYFSYRYVPEPSTMHKKIKRLLPGHFFTIDMDRPLEMERYWKPIFEPLVQEEEKVLKDIKDVLFDSVKKHMASDVKVGCLLSSGLDSTITTVIASKLEEDIITFTAYFDQGYSELEVAEETAHMLGVKNIPVKISAEEYMKVYPKMVYQMDDPLSDESAIALYFVSREAKKEVDILLSGEGADELFGGYKLYREPLQLGFFKYIPEFVKTPLLQSLINTRIGFKGKNTLIRGLQNIGERHYSNTRAFDDINKVKDLLKDFNEDYLPIDLAKKYYAEMEGSHDITKMQYVDLHLWAPGDILLKADKMVKANGVEARMPFLDREVFKVASKIHPKLNLRGETTKYMLRKAMKGLVPENVINRPKLGFPIPLDAWLRNEMYDWAINIIHEADVDEYINKSYVYSLFDEHLVGKKDNRRELWACITFMLWYQIYIQKNIKIHT